MIEIKREIKITGKYDVVVCGSGPAGLCAAMSAARQGAKTALVERFGCLGGNLTIGHVGPILGSVSSGTMADEISELFGVKGTGAFCDVEEAKIKLFEWIDHPNLDVFLNTPVVDVLMEKNTITGIIVGTQSGLEAIEGKIVIDATGDGVVSYLTGAEIEMGRQEDGLFQPTTIMFTLSNIDPEQDIECRHEEHDTLLEKGSYLALSKEASQNGILPDSVNIVRLYPTKHKDERMVNATQLNKINGLQATEITKAQKELRPQMKQVVDFLKDVVPGFENCKIKDSSDHIGVRETRRVIGEYVLHADDLLSGRIFDDVMVHQANFCIDIHNPDGAGQAESEGCPPEVLSYDIPYRCFVPKRIERLFTAGRCISGTHHAHASYRVMNICMAMGEAVGVAAALCAKLETIPRELNYRLAQQVLIEKGVVLK